MKLKKLISIGIASFMLVTTITNNIVFADNEEIKTIALTKPYEIQQPKSAIALSVSTATALLTLATHAGITFHNSESMDEFLYRFVGLGNVGSLIEELETAIKSTASGTINLSRSLLEEIQKAFNKLTVNVDNNYKIVDGSRILCVDTLHSAKQIQQIVESSQGLGVIVGGIFDESADNYTNTKAYNINGNHCEVSSGSYKVTFSSGTYTHYYLTLRCDGGSYPSEIKSSSDFEDGCRGSSGSGFYGFNIIPVLYNNTFGVYYQEYYRGTKPMSHGGESRFCKKHTLTLDSSATITKEINATVVGEGWSSGTGSINGNDGTATSDLDISIPNNMGTLVDLPSDSVMTPTYQTWTPGTDISVPEISNPGLVYTPEEIIPGDTDTETPGDTDVTNPLDWTWLKDLLNSILDFFKNFWDNLLQFLTSIFVPSDDFLVDKFNEFKVGLEEKVPNVNITKLEELAQGNKGFKDVYANIMGQDVLVLRLSVIERIISFSQPILQGAVAMYLLIYNYNQIYFMIRGSSLVGAKNTVENYQNKKIGGFK